MLETGAAQGWPIRLVLLIVCSSLAFGCSDATPTVGGPPATLVVVSGDAQQATVAQPLSDPIVVRVLDAGGRGIAGVTVVFEAAAGNGTVSPVQIPTDASGNAQTQWTMDTLAAVNRFLVARVDNVPLGEAPLVATIHATALSGPATELRIVTEPTTAAVSGMPLYVQPSVELADRYGNLVRQAGVIVSAAIDNVSVDRLSGTISLPTDSRGVAAFTDLTITGPAGEVRLVFSAPSLSAVTSSGINLLVN